MKRHTLTILTSILLLTGSASFAFAIGQNECETDSDCPGTKICVESQTDCATAPCAEGEDCPVTECNASAYKSCQLAEPAVCDTTADCGSGLVCMTRTNTTCTAGGETRPCSTEDGPDCDSLSDTDPQCETSTTGYCVPPYIAPCTDDASCGATGFTCKVVPVHCGCSSPGSTGSAGSGGSTGSGVPNSADAGSDNADFDNTAPEDCGCPEPDESNRFCELANISCTTNEECEGGFICHRLSSPTPGSSCSFDSSTGIETCDDPNEGNNYSNLGRCAPADYPYWMSSGGKGESAVTDGESNTGNNPGSNAPAKHNAGNDYDEWICGEGDSDGCHIASLNTGKTSTAALLLAGAAAFFAFRRRRKN